MVHQSSPFHILHAPQVSPFAALNVVRSLIDTFQRDARIHATSIQVTKVHPENAPLESYPQSPPVTPSDLSRLAQQGDYFSYVKKPVIFNDSFSTGFAVSPSSVDFSVLERIIPPNSRAEVRTFFDPSSDSALVTRINELAPGGILVLVYPTNQGAEAFHNNYLSPVLDPVLRTIMVRYGLSWDLANKLSYMESIRELPRYEGMKDKVVSLLAEMGQNGYGTTNPTFSLIRASRCVVPVPRKAWEKWWIHQEQPRVKKCLVDYYKRGDHVPREENITEALICRDIMESLEKRGEAAWEESGLGNGIEVGAFVIKRVE